MDMTEKLLIVLIIDATCVTGILLYLYMLIWRLERAFDKWIEVIQNR